jgi:AraC-like DNA-binding protein
VDSKTPLFSIKIERPDGAMPREEHPTDGETTFTSSDNNVKSHIHIIPRRAEDAAVVHVQIEVNRDEPFVMNLTRPVVSETLGIAVIFSGSSNLTFSNGATCRFEPGYCTIMGNHARGEAKWEINPGGLYESITFTYSRDERLETLRDIQLPPKFAELAADNIETMAMWQVQALPAFLRIAREAKANPYRGAAKQFFLESKALEMFSELVTLLDQAPQPDKTIGERELRHLNDIRDSLVARYDNPPSLIELSAEAGMNYKKLNHKFQQAFGATMHGFLREYRLEQGRKMIADGQGVKETSNMLGYRHPSAFINAYKRKFGHSPGGAGKPGNLS